MKKKILIGLGTLAFMAFLSLNINLTKIDTLNDVSLKDLVSIAQADGESQYQIYCDYYCRVGGTVCSLHVGFNDGTTGYINCPSMYF